MRPSDLKSSPPGKCFQEVRRRSFTSNISGSLNLNCLQVQCLFKLEFVLKTCRLNATLVLDGDSGRWKVRGYDTRSAETKFTTLLLRHYSEHPCPAMRRQIM